MKYLTLFILLYLYGSCFSQVEFDKTKFDFGDLESYSTRFVDITLTNKGNKQEWLLSVKKPREVVYINSKQFIEKDSSIIVRLQVNPLRKGKFAYNVEIFTSDRSEPVKVKLTGNLRSVDEGMNNGLAACPTFDERPGGKDPNAFKLTVVTIDAETKEELSNSTVSFIQNGREVWTKNTDRKGAIKEDGTLGLSYFYATHQGYYPEEVGTYINFQRNFVVLELEKDRTVPVAPPITDTIIVVNEPPQEIIDHIEADSSQIVIAPPEFHDLDKDDFSETHFNPINVVFVLDISSSMKQADKMELMKYSLTQLTDMLRPQDNMSIVTYSTSTDVLLKPTSGAQKEDITKQVEGLKAAGFTAGGKGIKLGYKQALSGKIDGGVNHVVIITDGAFNRESDDYKRVVRKYKRKGITLSVVGVKNKEKDKEEMQDAAKIGGGRYIPIFGLADAQNNLKQEIRLISFKRAN